MKEGFTNGKLNLVNTIWQCCGPSNSLVVPLPPVLICLFLKDR